MEVPAPLVWAAVAYMAASGLALAALGLLASPAAGVVRRRGAFFHDWNAALSAPWLFWHIGGLLFRLQETLGNYVLPAPQRVCELAYSHFRSQARCAAARGAARETRAAAQPPVRAPAGARQDLPVAHSTLTNQKPTDRHHRV
jgi:hypothetical protein